MRLWEVLSNPWLCKNLTVTRVFMAYVRVYGSVMQMVTFLPLLWVR